LTVSSETQSTASLLDLCIVLDAMLRAQVALEGIPAMEDLCALVDSARFAGLAATPGLDLEVLGILVSLPVVFAAKGLWARGIGATPWARMTVLMLPGERSALGC
jgi:hypothetical protein